MSAMNFGDERVPARFWEAVQPCPMSGCWLWTGGAHFYTKELKNWRRGARPPRVPYNVLYPAAAKTPLLQRCGADVCCNPAHMRHPVGHLDVQQAAARDRVSALRRLYGISVETIQKMLVEQRGRCAICTRKFTTSRYGSPCVDHCHRTGRIRGLLCRKCNAGLGQFKDCVFTLASAQQYVFKHNGMPTASVELEEGDPGWP